MIVDPFLRKIVGKSGRREITLSMVAQAEKERKNCKCENRYFIQTRIGGPRGRDYIEQTSANDLKHRINSMGNLAFHNAYGEIGSYCPDCERTLPVICGHGGSMWLCRRCAERILAETATDEDVGKRR